MKHIIANAMEVSQHSPRGTLPTIFLLRAMLYTTSIDLLRVYRAIYDCRETGSKTKVTDAIIAAGRPRTK